MSWQGLSLFLHCSRRRNQRSVTEGGASLLLSPMSAHLSRVSTLLRIHNSFFVSLWLVASVVEDPLSLDIAFIHPFAFYCTSNHWILDLASVVVQPVRNETSTPRSKRIDAPICIFGKDTLFRDVSLWSLLAFCCVCSILLLEHTAFWYGFCSLYAWTFRNIIMMLFALIVK